MTPELNDLCVRAAKAVGGGVVAIDVLEDPDRGLLVNEVNYTMEFRNSILPTGIDIPDRMVDFSLRVAKDGWAAANGWDSVTHPAQHGLFDLNRLKQDQPLCPLTSPHRRKSVDNYPKTGDEVAERVITNIMRSRLLAFRTHR